MGSRHCIGQLRWPVILATRAQEAQLDGTGIDEPWVDLMCVRAGIEAVSENTYWGGMQTDLPVSHIIWMRWVGVLDNTQVIKRVTTLPNGQLRTEIFRVRRYKEVNGRKRWVDVMCQEERAQ